MRSSSAFTRCALSVALAASFSCAKPKPLPVQEPLVTLEGEIRIAGAGSFDETIALADAGGSFCTLSGPKLEYELRNLAGQGVRVTGRLLGKTANGPEFFVESYEMTPVDGRRPAIGVVTSRNGELILMETRSGAIYRLDGPLAEALRAFPGCKVWVSGPTAPAGGGAGVVETLTVESYGVLMQAANPAGREP
jgi:hypothetical protein